MAKLEEATLAEATRRILAMRRVHVSRAKLAKALGVTMDVIRTVEAIGAGKTRHKARANIVRWMAKGGKALEAPPPLAPGRHRPGRPVGSRHRGRLPAALRNLAPDGSVMLEMEDGRAVRLHAGRGYRLRDKDLYEVLG